MDDLVTWLRAWLDTDEAACRREIDGGPVHDGPCINYEGQDPAAYDDYDSCIRHLNRYLPYSDPHRGLAEVEAKRRILDGHVPTDDRAPERGEDCRTCHEDLCDGWEPDPLDYPCPTVRLLALPYIDQPGYREEWRP